MMVNLRQAMGLAVAGTLFAFVPLLAEEAPRRYEPTPARQPDNRLPPPPTQEQINEDSAPRRNRGERDSNRWFERVGRFRTLDKHERDHESVRIAFRDVVNEPHRATVRVLCDDKAAALGSIVDADGYILTKASELRGRLAVKLQDKRLFDAELVGIDRKTDLAMLKIDAENLSVISWRDATDVPGVGSFLASSSLETLPVAIGVVSVQPRLIAAPSGVLGIVLGDDEDGAPVIREVVSGSGAVKAGIKPNDVVLSLNGQSMRGRDQLVEAIRQFQPGDKVMLEVRRGSERLDVQATLGARPSTSDSERRDFQDMLGGPLSERRTGFPLALQHDTVLTPQDCGGPLVDLDGRCVGINIARAGRVNSYALPTSVVLPLVAEFKAGKYAPEPSTDKLHLDLAKRWEALKQSESSLASKIAAVADSIRTLQDANEENREELLRRAEAERAAAESELVRIQAELAKLENQKTSLER